MLKLTHSTQVLVLKGLRWLLQRHNVLVVGEQHKSLEQSFLKRYSKLTAGDPVQKPKKIGLPKNIFKINHR